MKVPPISSRLQEQKSYKVKQTRDGDFSASLNSAKKEYAERELKKKLEKINGLGEEIKERPSLQKIKEYKELIRDYLSFVLKHFFKISQTYGMYSAQILTRVEVINRKIEELTSEFIRQQKENIDIVDRIDEIQGLLLDLYR
ncbi:MAG TPA: YaaR family protein [Bacillota bacterium]|nr:YaaR family protein [Bacillota bacterium]